jgi:hypothetical protein
MFHQGKVGIEADPPQKGRVNFDAAPQVTGVDNPSCARICRAWTSD